MIARVSGLRPARNNPKMAAGNTQNETLITNSQNLPQSSEKDIGKPGLELSLKLLIAAFCASIGYCIFMGVKNTFAKAK